MKGRAGAGWVVVLAGLLAAAGGAAVRATARAPLPDLAGAAAAARRHIEQALAAQARALEPTAVAAGRIRELEAALDMNVDRATCQDLLENEEWWSSFRSTFPMTAVIVDGPLGVVGPAVAGLADSEIVRRARQTGVASGVLPGKERAFLAAAATVATARRLEKKPVVMMAAPLDGAVFKSISESTGDVVGLADGATLLQVAGPLGVAAPAGAAAPGGATGGPAALGRNLRPLLDSASTEPRFLEDGWVGVAWPIGGGLSLLAAFAPPPTPVAPMNRGLPMLVGGGLLVVAGAALVMRARATRARTQASPKASPQAPEAEGESGVRGTANAARTVGGAPAVGRGDQSATGPGSAPGSRAANPAARGISGDRGSIAYATKPNPLAAPPETLGRYELIERIGEGGMAEIFFAAARGAENFVRYFVVKRMHPQLARNKEAVNQFIDEGRLQAGLVHSNIVPVFDFGKAEGEYFLALEYIHGKDVSQIVQRHVEHFGRPLDAPIAMFIVSEVLEALAFAHSQIAQDGTPMDIVHRDVSPGNVLVSYRGEVKLTDFGIAKSDRRVSHTEVGMVKGNASFMSPEQARGEAVDIRSDLFSAGLVLFYCMTSQYLYRGETTLNRLLRAAVGPATSQFDQIDQLPIEAAKVLRRALALDPGKRYASAAEFAQEVSATMAGRNELTRVMDVLFPTSQRRDLRGV